MSFVFIEMGQVSFVLEQVIFTFHLVLGPEKSICQPLHVTVIKVWEITGAYSDVKMNNGRRLTPL